MSTHDPITEAGNEAPQPESRGRGANRAETFFMVSLLFGMMFLQSFISPHSRSGSS